jgi:hypothetical protein
MGSPADAARIDLRSSGLTLLGYVGVAVSLSATSVVLGDRVGTLTQVLVDVAIVTVLLTGGWFIGRVTGDAHRRARSVFWFGALFGWADLMTIAFGGEGLRLEGRWAVVAPAYATAALAVPLWLLERRSLQFIGAFLSLHVGTVALVARERRLFTIAVPDTDAFAWVTLLFGLVALVAGYLTVVSPRRTAMVVGTLAAVVGAVAIDVDLLTQMPSNVALALGVALAVAATLLADRADLREPAAVGIAATIVTMAALVGNTVQERTEAVAVLVLGLVLVGAAVALTLAFAPPPPPADEGDDADA